MPGWTTLKRTCGAQSFASARIIDCSAPLAVVYDTCPLGARSTAMSVTATTDRSALGWSGLGRSVARMAAWAPMWMAMSICVRSMSPTSLAWYAEALHTTTVTPFEASHAGTEKFSAAKSRGVWWMTTDKPRACSARAMAAPPRPEPPVINAQAWPSPPGESGLSWKEVTMSLGAVKWMEIALGLASACIFARRGC